MTTNWSYIIMSGKSLQENWKFFQNFIKIFQQPYQLISKRFSNLWGDLKNLGISRKKNFQNIEKNENFHFWKILGTLISKYCREMSCRCFWVPFLGIDGGTCQEAQCAIKWTFFKNKTLRKLEKMKTDNTT